MLSRLPLGVDSPLHSFSFAAALVAALVALVLVVPPVAADDVATLSGQVTVAGERTAVQQVRVPQPATLSLEREESSHWVFRHLSVEGEGRVQGFWLVDDPVERTVQVLVLHKSEGTGYDDRRTMAYARWETDDGVLGCGDCQVPLPAGDYHLYLIADDTPALVSLDLDGLVGETALAPDHEVGGEQFQVQTTDDGVAGKATVWRDRATATMADDGVIFLLQWTYAQSDELAAGRRVPRANARGACRYEGEPTEAELHGPGCYGGESAGFLGAGASPTGGASGNFSLSLGYDYEPGPYTYSAWAASGGASMTAGLAGVFLPYR